MLRPRRIPETERRQQLTLHPNVSAEDMHNILQTNAQCRVERKLSLVELVKERKLKIDEERMKRERRRMLIALKVLEMRQLQQQEQKQQQHKEEEDREFYPPRRHHDQQQQQQEEATSSMMTRERSFVARQSRRTGITDGGLSISISIASL